MDADFLKNIDLGAFADRAIARLKEEDQKRKTYFNSPEFEAHFTAVSNHVTEFGGLTDNPYSFSCSGIDNTQFCYFVSVVIGMNTASCIENIDPECPFETETVDYRGLRFETMHGQGTAFFVSTLAW
jgi:hypothetical protein